MRRHERENLILKLKNGKTVILPDMPSLVSFISEYGPVRLALPKAAKHGQLIVEAETFGKKEP